MKSDAVNSWSGWREAEGEGNILVFAKKAARQREMEDLARSRERECFRDVIAG